jgi:hypothetical protein
VAVAARVGAPADQAELFEKYYEYMVSLARQQGIHLQEAEDVASDILTRLLERDVIGMFDPDHEIVHGGQQHAANFKTFLSHQVLLYIKGKRDALSRRSAREPLLCDQPSEDGGSWLEAHGSAFSFLDDYSNLSTMEFVSWGRAVLASIPRRSLRDRCDLVALFDAMVASGLRDGRVDYPALREQFQISPTSAYQWVGRLRDALREAPEKISLPAAAPVVAWTVGGVTLTIADVQDAIEVLKSTAGGIMVRQPLAKAGHVLQHADKDWYHSFSAEERKLFPALEIDPQTHKKPAGHVRLAVVHRLERMLAEAVSVDAGESAKPVLPVAVPDEPVDLFEAELWKLGATPEMVDRITSLAQAAFTAA